MEISFILGEKVVVRSKFKKNRFYLGEITSYKREKDEYLVSIQPLQHSEWYVAEQIISPTENFLKKFKNGVYIEEERFDVTKK